MNASEILATLTQKGVQIWVENEKLNIRSPKGVLTPDIQAEITARKPEILEFLRESDSKYHLMYSYNTITTRFKFTNYWSFNWRIWRSIKSRV